MRAHGRLNRGFRAEHVVDDQRQPASDVAEYGVRFHGLAVGKAPALVEPGCHLESVADGSTQLAARRPGEDGDAVFHRTPWSCRDHRMQLTRQFRVSALDGRRVGAIFRLAAQSPRFVVSARQ